MKHLSYGLVVSLLLSLLSPAPAQGKYADDFQSSLQALNVGAIFHDDPTYANVTTPYNLRYHFSPVSVTFPRTAQDVSNIVKIGAHFNKTMVPRSGGHSYISNGLGGTDGVLILDMSNFKSITVHEDNTATIESGNRLGDIALGLFHQGERALPHGACPYVGIGGHASYGGFGFTSRMWGLTLDTILSINLVLANGTIATTSKAQNSDLFWAMRGAGSSFGITTSITVQTFPAPLSGIIFIYGWILTPANATYLISSFQNFVLTNDTLPQQLGGEFYVTPGLSPGTVSIYFFGGWWGEPDDLDAVLEPYMSRLPKPASASVQRGTYLDSLVARAGNMTLDTTTGPDVMDTFYVKSLMTPEDSPLSDEALEAYFSYLATEGASSEVGWFSEIELYGGKNSRINEIPLDETAFAHRKTLWTIQMYGYSKSRLPPFPESGFAFVDGMLNSILNNSPKNVYYGAYPNYVDDRLENYEHLYFGSHYQKLQGLKTKYDPRNRFRFPTGIRPL
ncbi:Glucooligosaccharide oxidase [Amanita thiersii Skay4041]|uniref:Glucooligosaccharide oxidase n=1 Tax=Amanita thiersii Skay4041 TaxID=703135 RepID=A0A2A9NBZ9_9AGAR|nr:Glucooligosaccharide oxidase [Amanita thiersii Skay4041]